MGAFLKRNFQHTCTYLSKIDMAASTASSLDKQLQTLSAGFDALQDEYQRLWNRCQTLESSLETAKTQVSSNHLFYTQYPSPSMMNLFSFRPIAVRSGDSLNVLIRL